MDTALSLVVTARGAKSEQTIIDLPLQDNISTTSIVFETQDWKKVTLVFDVVRTYAGAHDEFVGRGIAVLSNVNLIDKDKKVSLQHGVTVPILAVNTLDVLGSVNFEFLVVTPF